MPIDIAKTFPPIPLSYEEQIRDAYAGVAMGALLSSSPVVREDDPDYFGDMIARASYRYADAMLRARKSKP